MKNTAQHQTKTTCCFNKEQPTYPFLGERQKQTTLKSLTLSLLRWCESVADVEEAVGVGGPRGEFHLRAVFSTGGH